MLIPIDFFVDPLTKEKLTYGKNCLKNKKKQRYFFDPLNKYWKFMPKKNSDLKKNKWVIWKRLQMNGVSSYVREPQKNLGVGNRKDYIEFAEFMHLKGFVLDVGVGPQSQPTHLFYQKKKDFFFIGIDPLLGEQPRKYAFVQGLGEFLPFRSALFDHIVFATSLDHFIKPKKALFEASRVLKNSGSIYIWLGIKDKKAPLQIKSPAWYKKLIKPQGAEDVFHYKRYHINGFIKDVDKTSFRIIRRKKIEIDQWRTNYFYEIVKK